MSISSIEKLKPDGRLSVVVVGGGLAGAEVIRGLSVKLDSRKHRLILVTARPCYTFLPSVLRLLFCPNVPINSVFMPYDNIFGKFPGEIKIGTVTSIEENKDPFTSRGGFVVLDGGETVIYDALVVATGSSFDGHLAIPNEKTAFEEHVFNCRAQTKAAQNIVIVGGGAVGIEISGEIKDSYPSKSITIIQANNLLFGDTYPDKYRIDVERRLRQRGVNMVFNDTIEGEPTPDGPLKTNKGLSLPCDLIIYARGGRPNTTLLKFLRPFVLTHRGYVRVNSNLQIEGHHNIFALGDIIDWPETKQLSKIKNHAPVVVANVMCYLEGRLPRKTYVKSTEVIATSIGRGGGASYLGYLWGFTFGDYFTGYFKSSDLLVGWARKRMGLPSIQAS